MIIILFLSLFGFTQELREQAISESATAVEQNNEALQAAGVIRINNNDLNPKVSRNSTSLGIQFENYRPVGTGEIIGVSTYDLQQSGSTILPSLALGTMSPKIDLGEMILSYGLEGTLGYTSQSLNLITPSGVNIDSKLQTLKVSIAPALTYHWQSLEKLETRAQAGLGWMQLTQSSESSLARWTKQSQYWFYSVGVAWNWTSSFATSLMYSERKSLENRTDWSVSAANVQVGAEVKW